MKLSDERFLLVLCLAFFAVTYTITYHQHALYADENSYLGLGQDILEGRYSEGMADRAPMLPLMVSACYLLGLDPFQVKFVLPLIAGLLFIFAVFLLGRRLCKRPFIPVIITLSFPFFWQWVPFVLVDVLLGIFSALSALFLHKGIVHKTTNQKHETALANRCKLSGAPCQLDNCSSGQVHQDNEKYLTPFMLFLSLAILTKVSAIILIPAFLIYIVIMKRLSILLSRPFLKGLALFLVILIPALILTALSSGSLGINTRFMTMEYFRIPYYYFMNFALVPWSLPFLYGIYKTIKMHKNRMADERGYAFSLLLFLVVFVFFSLLVWKEMRFLLFVLPFFAVVAERGIASFGSRPAYALTALFFAAGFALSLLLLGAASYVTWGDDMLTRELLTLPQSSRIAYDSLLVYNRGLAGRAIKIPVNATGEWIMENSPDYLSLSLYGELDRAPNMSYYKPRLGPIDISLLESGNPKKILTWWPGYRFNSQLYQWANSNLPVHKKIKFQGQDIFIIYRVS